MPSLPYCAGTTANPCPQYGGNLQNLRHFAANAWTDFIVLTGPTLRLENNFDFLRGGAVTNGAGGAAQFSLTGNQTNFSATIDLFSTSKRLGFIGFSSDGSVQDQGFNINQVGICTFSGVASTEVPLMLGYRTNAILQGPGDVIYGRDAFSGGAHRTIAVWRDTGTVDADIYVRCGALPTATAYDASSISGNISEFVEFSCASGGIPYYAVSSNSGSGVVSIVPARHPPQTHRTLSVATGYTLANWWDMFNFVPLLQGAAAHIYGATEGQVVLNFNFHTTANCANCAGALCSICLEDFNPQGRSNSGLCGGRIQLFGESRDVETLSHELGHLIGCARDEYADPPTPPGGPSVFLCGHSIMANPWGDNNNFCTDQNHKRNRDPNLMYADTPVLPALTQFLQANPGGTGWEGTPDNHDYQNQNFNNFLGTVTFVP